MRSTIRALAALASAACLIAPSAAQTYTNCNPTVRTDCPPDSALARTVNIDLSSESDSFTPQSNPTYGDDGVSFTIRKSGDAPQLTSKWYIMFGKVDVVLKASPGAGIVSSFVMQSDTLDEIDWEWLGTNPDEVQTNYFGKGQTTSYNRGAFHADPGSQSEFKTYSIEWTPEQIVWQIDGKTVRTLEPANAENQYPQTPMQIKFGSWAGGDPGNAAGTIEWARGPTDYTKGPFTMTVKSLKVQDYSTGTQYVYGDTSGTWRSIKSNGGTIYSGGDKPLNSDSPQITATASGAPLPFTPSRTSSDYERPSVYPWIPGTSSPTPEPTFGNYPGLPSGWTVSDSGKVLPPSSAPVSKPSVHSPKAFESFANSRLQQSPLASSTASPAASQSASSGDSKPLIWTGYDDRGFTTIYTSYPGTTQAPATALPATEAAAQPTSTVHISSDLALQNNAAETAPPVPKANGAQGLYSIMTSTAYIFTVLFITMTAGYVF